VVAHLHHGYSRAYRLDYAHAVMAQHEGLIT
jgi:hypothetical protein